MHDVEYKPLSPLTLTKTWGHADTVGLLEIKGNLSKNRLQETHRNRIKALHFSVLCFLPPKQKFFQVMSIKADWLFNSRRKEGLSSMLLCPFFITEKPFKSSNFTSTDWKCLVEFISSIFCVLLSKEPLHPFFILLASPVTAELWTKA